jgi:hypothetical protein
MKDHIFQKNLERWAQTDPKHAVKLSYLETSNYRFCQTVQEEANQWFAGLDLEKVPVIFVYGIGLGYYYEAAKAWLKKRRERRLVFLEDDLTVIHRFLQTERATELLQDRQVQLLYFEDLKDKEGVFETLYWNFAMKRIIVTASQLYQKTKGELFAELRHKIAHDSAIKNALVEEYLRFGGAFFVNFYQNLLSLPGSYLGNKTFGSFRKVPAIICGAGPSLAKQFERLPKLMDRALIFAGGSALNALNAAGIQPHLGAGIDPNPAQFERLSQNLAYEVPFYYRNRMYHDAFEMIHGPRLYITGCGGYDVSDFFEERLKIQQEFLDEGHNVINFCLQVAHQLGCDPIIFVGLDLAFTGMKIYAPGVEEKVEFDPNKALDVDDFDERPLVQKDIEGQPIYTLWKWIAESEWIGEFAKEHPEVRLINCTEGGLGFPGVVNRSLEEVAAESLTRSYDLEDRLHGEIQNTAMPKITFNRVRTLMQELKESLERCVSDFEILIEETQKIVKEIEIDHRLPAHLQTGRAALVETELAEEVGYQYVLDIFNAIQIRLLNRALQENKFIPKWRQVVKRLKLNLSRFKFLQKVAKVNIEIMKIVLANRKAKKGRKKPGKLSKPTEEVVESSIKGFNPIRLPSEPYEGQSLPDGHVVRVFRQYGRPPEECRIEKGGIPDGQCLLYYGNGRPKFEAFYRQGKLQGPATFFSLEGKVLAKSYYEDGRREGVSLWYYPSGALYAIQRYSQGRSEGVQEFFYEDGAVKSTFTCHLGIPIDAEK